MPELPEVETIVRALRQSPIVGQSVGSAHLLWPRSLAVPSETELHARLPGQVLHSIDRRGKFILLHFDQHTLLIHLRMSGDLRVIPTPDSSLLPPPSSLLPSPPASFHTEEDSLLHPSSFILPPSSLLPPPSSLHARFWLDFDNGQRLVFNDARKFGRLWLVTDPQEVTGGLGPEPLDETLTLQEFHNRLAARQRQLKPLLLDQTFLAGLGNIYTDEALHLARLHPLALSNQLTLAQSAALLLAIRSTLQDGINRSGASIDWVYRGGSFQNHFRAYQRTGLPCPVCGAPIQRITIGQRGTHFCPNCQVI
jgi:formamidopyrimidine-DNA glycosylase